MAKMKNAVDTTGTTIYVTNAESPVLDQLNAYLPFNQYGTIVEGLNYDQQVSYIGNLPDMLVADAACGTGTPVSASMSDKTWVPKAWRGDVEQCEVDLRNSKMFRVASGTGANRTDLTQNQLFVGVITNMVLARAAFDLHKLAWFGDTAITSPPLTNAGLVPFYSVFDGLFKRIDAGVTAGDTYRATITANAAATKATQLSTLTDTDAYNAIKELAENVDNRLYSAFGLTPVFIVTKTIADKYKDFLRDKGNVEAYRKFENGQEMLSFDGIPIYVETAWDTTIREAFDNGTTYDKPHRVVLTAKENLQLGMGTANDILNIKTGYDERDEIWYAKVKGWGDTQTVFDYLTAIAW